MEVKRHEQSRSAAAVAPPPRRSLDSSVFYRLREFLPSIATCSWLRFMSKSQLGSVHFLLEISQANLNSALLRSVSSCCVIAKDSAIILGSKFLSLAAAGR